MGPGGNADLPRSSGLVEHPQILEIAVIHHHTTVRTITDVDVTLVVRRYGVRKVEFVEPVSPHPAPHLRDVLSVRRVFHDSVVGVAVRDEDVVVLVPRDIGRPCEEVTLIRARSPRRGGRTLYGRRTIAKHHHHPTLGVELDDLVRSFVDRPDVVVLVDPNFVGELEAVEPGTDLALEVAILIELEQPSVLAPMIHEDVTRRVRRNTDALAEIQTLGELEEALDGLDRNDGGILVCRRTSPPTLGTVERTYPGQGQTCRYGHEISCTVLPHGNLRRGLIRAVQC